MRSLLRPRLRLAHLLAALAVLAVAMVPAAHWWRERAKRAALDRAGLWAFPIAERAYQQRFGQPAPHLRSLPAGEVAHTRIRWDRTRRAYIVGFVQQWVVNRARESRGRPIPYTSGYTVTESFAVKPDSSCEYVAHLSGGPY